MSIPHRDFMKSLRISIGSILLAGCAQPNGQGDPQAISQISTQTSSFNALPNMEAVTVEPYPTSTALFPQEPTTHIDAAPTEIPTTTEIFPFNDPTLPPRARLRHCWFYLSWLARRYVEDPAQGEWARDLLVTSHRAALVELIVAGKMSEAIARDVQKGFDSAINHLHERCTSRLL